ncbi:MAG: ribosomal protein S18-alanine N-acetyltransferase [Candidatus Saliniplasma sp.]
MKELTIRKCRKKDISSVINVENESFEYPYSERVFKTFLKSDKFIVAQVRDNIVGYILADTREGQGIILSIGVLPEYRRKGIGSKLMESVFGILDTEIVRLTLRKSNLSAFRFYERLGFKVVGYINGYYKNGEDAIVMKKNIG